MATVNVVGYTGTYDAQAHGATGTAKGVGDVNLNSSLNLGATYTDAPGGTASWSFAGGTNYTDQSGSVNIVINKAVATVEVSGYTGTYDAQAHGATGTAKGVGDVNLISSLNLGTTFTDAPGGTANWTFTGGTNYTDQSGSVNIVINKAVATVEVTGYTGTYDAQVHGATGTAKGVGDVNLISSLSFGSTYTDAPGGTANWMFTGGTNYTDQSGSVNIVINKAVATVNVTGYTGTYDAQAHGATGTAKGVGDVNLTSSLSFGNTYTDAPGGTANWSFAGGTNYTDQSGSVNIVINKAVATVEVTGYTGTYDAQAHGATGTAKGVGDVNLISSLNLGTTFTDAPGGTASWSFAGGTNYTDQSGSVNIVINKAVATVEVTGYTGTYDAQAHGATGTAKGVGGTDVGTLSLGATYTDAPGGTASWSFAGGTNYTDQSGSVNIVINKAVATVEVTGYTGTYDAQAHGATGTAKGVGGTDVGTLSLGATYTDAPGGTASWSFAGGTNYTDQSGSVNIVINKAVATVEVTGYTGTYDAQAHGATGTAKGVGDVNLISSLNLGTTFTDAPGGTASWTFTGGTNYTDQNGSVAIVINKAVATVEVTGYTGTYNAQAHGATGTAKGVGDVNLISSLSFGNTYTNVPGGTADWTFTGGTNYTNQSGSVNIVINKATASVTPTAKSKVYGTNDPVLNGSFAGFVGSDGITASYSRQAGELVGSYTISATLSPTGPLSNYNITYNTAELTITKAVLTVTAQDKSVQYSDIIPAYTASFTGFVGVDNAGNAVSGLPAFTTNANVGGNGAMLSGPGVYSIVPGLGTLTAANYSFSFVNGIMTVTKENSDLNYSGAEFFSTGSSTSTQAIIALSSTITDKNDGNNGDVRNAKIDMTGVTGGTNLSVGLVNPNDTRVGTATLSNINVSLSSNDLANGGKSLEVTMISNGFYTSDQLTQVVTIGVPGADFVTGGGNQVMGSSVNGEFAGTPGAKMNFGFTMKYNKSGKNLQGQITTIFRRYETIDGVEGWYTYKIKSNAINSLAVTTAGGYRKGVISTKANLDRTSPLGVVTSLGGNHDLVLEAWESTTNGVPHQIGVILRRSNNGGGVLFCNNWTGTTYAVAPINGGNIRVLNSAGARVAAEEPVMELAVEASPNPTNGLLKLSVTGAGEQPTVQVRLYNLMQRVTREWTLDIENGKGEKTIDMRSAEDGIYLLSVEGDQKRAVKRVVKAN
ncbi:MBG domain-containing protein [Spirosoma aerophilum]